LRISGNKFAYGTPLNGYIQNLNSCAIYDYKRPMGVDKVTDLELQ